MEGTFGRIRNSMDHVWGVAVGNLHSRLDGGRDGGMEEYDLLA